MLGKIDDLYLATFLIKTPTLDCKVVQCDFKSIYQKRHVLEKNWTMCLKYDKHSRLNSQHNGGEGVPIQPFNEHENLHFDNKLKLSYEVQYYKEICYGFNLDMLTTLRD